MRRQLRHLWNHFERLFARVLRLRPIGEIGRVRRVAYRVPAERWPVGTPVLELHLNSELLGAFHEGGSAAAGLRFIRAARRGLSEVAALLATDPGYADCQGVYGVTLLSRGLESLGFEVQELKPGFYRWWMQLWTAWLLTIYHPAGAARLRQGSEPLTIKLVAMERSVLLDRYLKGGRLRG